LRSSDRTAETEARSPRSDIGELVIGAADGDFRAWEELVASYSDLVSSITVAHRLNVEDTARVQATVWIRLGRNLGKIRQPDLVGAWLGAVVRDECVKAITASKCTAA
jgi:hypothetical protein